MPTIQTTRDQLNFVRRQATRSMTIALTDLTNDKPDFDHAFEYTEKALKFVEQLRIIDAQIQCMEA